MDSLDASIEPVTRRPIFSSWPISLLIHAIFLVILTLFTFSEMIPTLIVLLGSMDNVELETSFLSLHIHSLASFDPVVDEGDFAQSEAVAIPETDGRLIELPDPTPASDSTFESRNMDVSIQSLLGIGQQSTLKIGRSTSHIRDTLTGRPAVAKARLLEKYGGSKESEKAVHLAVQWFAQHQVEDGSWSFTHHTICNGQCDHPGNFGIARNGATAIALLLFLRAGHTHQSGDYREHVKRGLQYLVSNINKENSGSIDVKGSWHEMQGTMYSHCLATIALCEAYAMTEVSWLRAPAQAGVDVLARSQNRTNGGWRYTPGDRGDTSVVGWALMALKSAQVGGLEVPEETLKRFYRFLGRVSSNQGSTYGYMAPEKNIWLRSY